MFASEYGWTADYVLNALTGKQVRGMLNALEHRYARQADAMKEAGGNKVSPSDLFNDDPNVETIEFSEIMSDAALAMLGIQVAT